MAGAGRNSAWNSGEPGSGPAASRCASIGFQQFEGAHRIAVIQVLVDLPDVEIRPSDSRSAEIDQGLQKFGAGAANSIDDPIAYRIGSRGSAGKFAYKPPRTGRSGIAAQCRLEKENPAYQRHIPEQHGKDELRQQHHSVRTVVQPREFGNQARNEAAYRAQNVRGPARQGTETRYLRG